MWPRSVALHAVGDVSLSSLLAWLRPGLAGSAVMFCVPLEGDVGPIRRFGDTKRSALKDKKKKMWLLQKPKHFLFFKIHFQKIIQKRVFAWVPSSVSHPKAFVFLICSFVCWFALSSADLWFRLLICCFVYYFARLRLVWESDSAVRRVIWDFGARFKGRRT